MGDSIQKQGVTKKKSTRRISKSNIAKTLLVEVAWEVCNQVGGIYTVIRSKTPVATKKWGENYCLVGPYVNHSNVSTHFEPLPLDEDKPFCKAVKTMREWGFDVHYGEWLVTGRPRVVLLNPDSVNDRLGEIKYDLWENHQIESPSEDNLLDELLAFSYLTEKFFEILATHEITNKNIIGHFHEWMVGLPILNIKRKNFKVSTVFTTHATLLGRYLAMNDPSFYDHLAFYDWHKEAVNFNIEAQVKIERYAAQATDVLTTVSEITGKECEALLGRVPDEILPNGFNIERFTALHEFQNLHQDYKEKIHQFVMAHFFQTYTFDLDNTLYFFTSGRFEYKNKGFDVTIEALAKLNYRLQQEGSDITIVMFFITKQPYHSINPAVLQSKAMIEELRTTTKMIQKQIGDRMFYAAASSDEYKLPSLNDFVDDYWKLRYRRTLQSWKTDKLPEIVTHNLKDDVNDPILNFLRVSNLVNHKEDRVKIVYHPDFINSTNPLFGMDYRQFVRGCHLGIFPSYYEPWGYTPLECMASGVPAVTSDLSGFGDYVEKNLPEFEDKGIYVNNRDHSSFEASADQLANKLYKFIKLTRKERIALRNKTEEASEFFDWRSLIHHYDKAYNLAIKKL
ncbi:glycosyltransferase [Aureibacter tunicatorum]|uniref:Glycogen(Starch) synthase n=1 Tax=Aureibacter tunicatorum TaxID=866807 RepID=A0AAE3XK25_9BACT|nr:glycosyltransferase [Aureibacter tunicatorum]MDR6237862.1 glycogen(starch) synthase [Aureibacter tunicatorum]BDD02897.1 glycosyl transferase [Aureibacter tunicatorum]